MIGPILHHLFSWVFSWSFEMDLKAHHEKWTLPSLGSCETLKASSGKLRQSPHLRFGVVNSTASTLEGCLTQISRKVKSSCDTLPVSLSCRLDSTELSVECWRVSQLGPWSQRSMGMSVGTIFKLSFMVRRFRPLQAEPPWFWVVFKRRRKRIVLGTSQREQTRKKCLPLLDFHR